MAAHRGRLSTEVAAQALDLSPRPRVLTCVWGGGGCVSWNIIFLSVFCGQLGGVGPGGDGVSE